MLCVVYHLPKISGLSRCARLDSSLQHETSAKLKKLVNGKRISIRNVPTGKTGLPFQNFRLSLEFSSGTNQKKLLPFTSQPEFPGICGKW